MSVKIIDVDPGVLQKTSQAALHAAKQSWAHLNAELVFETVGEVDSVMATLVDDEPYSFISGGSEGEMVTLGSRSNQVSLSPTRLCSNTIAGSTALI